METEIVDQAAPAAGETQHFKLVTSLIQFLSPQVLPDLVLF